MKKPFFFTAFLVLIPLFSFSQWTLQGNHIDGQVAERFGRSVSLSNDGNRLASGAPDNDDNGNLSGHVRVFEWQGGNWVQLGTNIAGEAAGDASGNSVSLDGSGNRVAIGARFNDGNGMASGHVRVFEFNGADWVQLGQDINGEAPDDYSGFVSLSADGNRLAIGAEHNDGNGMDSGHVRVFEFDGMNWTQLGGDIDGEAAEDEFGRAVSLSAHGNRLIVGAIDNDGNGMSSGHVRVFEFNGADWIQLGTDIDGQVAGDRFGFSVSINANGNRIAAGATGNDGNGMDSGHVRVFEFNGIDWIQLGANINGEAPQDYSGTAVSMSNNGNRLAICAFENDDGALNSGHVRVFEFNGIDWVQIGMDIDGSASSEWFGTALSLNNDGSVMAIGAPQNSENGNWAGRVFVYTSQLPYTVIPDPNFEQALIDQGIDSEGILNGQVLTSDIAGVTTLLISNLGIADLTGIEDFSALFSLRCDMNQLTTLDMSSNPNLVNLSCANNQLSAINVSNSSNLRRLFCQGNQLTELDVTGLSALQFLNASNNPMLSCIAVDNPVDAMAQTTLYTYWVVDDLMVFDSNCGMIARGETSSGIKNIENNVDAPEESLYSASIYPNPAGDWLHIILPAEETIANVIFYNLQGQQVLASKSNKINITSLAEGLYFASIQIYHHKQPVYKKMMISRD